MIKQKHKKLLGIMIFCIWGFVFSLQAQQSIFIEQTNGDLCEISLNLVQKITFSDTDMILHKTDATVLSWPTQDVQKYYYDLTTQVNKPVISTGTDPFHVLLYPNPSNGHFKIKYRVEKRSHIDIVLIDMSGRIVKVLLSENKEHGTYTFNSQGKKLTTGTYFLKIGNEKQASAHTLVILK